MRSNPNPQLARASRLDSTWLRSPRVQAILRRKPSGQSSDCDANRCDRESANRELCKPRSAATLQPQRSIAAMHVIALLLAGAAALKPLTGRVALVTGASRGIGKGIALELGAAGCTVYCAARSSRGGFVSDDRPVAASVGDLTVEQTAEKVSESGGKGIAVPCDCSDEKAIEAIVERIRRDEGRLDVIVPSAFATPPKLADAAFRDDFWKQGMEMWDCCHGVGLRGTYATLLKSTPLLIETAQKYKSRPLACLISSFGGQAYTFNVAYGVGKAATDRLARDASAQLSKYNVDPISLYPGVVATEGIVEMEER